MENEIKQILQSSAQLKHSIASDQAILTIIERAARKMLETIKAGGTIYSCGNGGSACDAMHFTEELVARYKRERRGIRAAHFLDPSTLTCWANDYEYAGIFERQVLTFCGPKDLLLVLSTSGNSPNTTRAATAAKTTGTFTFAMTGKGGGKIKDLCDLALVVPSQDTERIQEVHITILHILCELIESNLR